MLLLFLLLFQRMTIITTWFSLEDSGPGDGISFFFPNARGGPHDAEGLWGALKARAGMLPPRGPWEGPPEEAPRSPANNMKQQGGPPRS